MIRTGAEYRDGLRDGREIWVDGEQVKDITRHRALQPVIDIRVRMYDMQHESAHAPVLTYVEDNKQHSIFNRLPREQKEHTERGFGTGLRFRRPHIPRFGETSTQQAVSGGTPRNYRCQRQPQQPSLPASWGAFCHYLQDRRGNLDAPAQSARLRDVGRGCRGGTAASADGSRLPADRRGAIVATGAIGRSARSDRAAASPPTRLPRWGRWVWIGDLGIAGARV
jgi:hypothetical protein